MGKRRIRNLKTLKEREIFGFDIDERKRIEAKEKYGIKTFKYLKKAILKDSDAIIICTPPHQHLKYALESIKEKKHFFTELNLISSDVKKMIRNLEGENIIAVASSTMRYIESIKRIKKLIEEKEIGKVVSLMYHVGQYLPDWHPWEDYRQAFFTRKDTNACREILAIELNWLTWVFGEIESVSCIKGKFSSLDIEIDDVCNVIMKFKENTLANISIDAISRIPYRQLKVIGENGVITWDKTVNSVKLYTVKNKKWKEYKENKSKVNERSFVNEESYVNEMKAFIEAINNKKNYYTLNSEIKLLKVLDAIDKSNKESKHFNTR